jgi:hypothetical protein
MSQGLCIDTIFKREEKGRESIWREGGREEDRDGKWK